VAESSEASLNTVAIQMNATFAAKAIKTGVFFGHAQFEFAGGMHIAN